MTKLRPGWLLRDVTKAANRIYKEAKMSDDIDCTNSTTVTLAWAQYQKLAKERDEAQQDVAELKRIADSACIENIDLHTALSDARRRIGELEEALQEVREERDALYWKDGQ